MADSRRVDPRGASARDTAVPGGASGRRPRRRATLTEHSERGEKLLAGVPARIMRPRLVFMACLGAILAFGLLMVYSASAVEALKENGSSYYFLFRQFALMCIGLVLAVMIAKGFPFGLESFMGKPSRALWWGIVVLLGAVLVLGAASHGAVRWINLGFFTLQPSEFAKPVIIIAAARLMTEFYERGSYDNLTFLLKLGAAVIVPLALIFAQPDLGTTLIIAGTVFFMLVLCGVSFKFILMLMAAVLVLGVAAVLIAPYRMARIFAVSDPWADPYGDGYQATLAIMAFASGGLFGRGVGNSTMKYHYLPEAHNDYILAIIGEELGFVGTLLFFAVFMLMIYAGFKIAERCPSMQGRLIAYGCSIVLVLQFFVNALGILGVTPMTGKTLPFISYGGSSMMASLILAGLIVRVSVESNPRTVHDARRDDFAVIADGGDVSGHIGRSTAGTPRVRSSRTAPADARRRAPERGGFSVMDGGSRPGAAERPRPRTATRRPPAQGGYERINLNDNPSERLRSRGPRVQQDSRRDPRGGSGRRGPAGPGRDGRGRYDR